MKQDYRVINLRAFAIFLIVFGHSIIIYSSQWNIMESDVTSSILCFVKDRIINPIQLDIFFAISGFLFYYTVSGGGSFVKTIKKKAKRLLIPYFSIAFLWMNPVKYILSVPGYESSSDVLNIYLWQVLFTGNLGHLWYLPTLFLLFTLLHYPLKRMISSDKSLIIMVTFALVLRIIVNYIFVPSWVQLNQVVRYALPFVIGFTANRISINISDTKLILLMLLSFAILVGIPPLQILAVPVFLLSALKAFPQDNNRIIYNISRNSFGLYLFHSPLIYITFKFLANSSPLIVVTINFVIFGALAYIMTSLIRLTKYKYVIGE